MRPVGDLSRMEIYMDSKKVGIIGGTFNPIHLGHLLLAEWAKEKMALDEVLFIPTGNSYMKKDTPILPGKERLHMVNLAINSRVDFVSSDIEVIRSGHTYTYETLEILKKENPNTMYYFIAGADCLYSIETWAHPEKIFENCTLIVATRSDISLEKLDEKAEELKKYYQGEIHLISFLNIDISSSNIRERLLEGKSIRYMVPDDVITYIDEKKFYINLGGNIN